jgi:peptidase M23-like protein
VRSHRITARGLLAIAALALATGAAAQPTGKVPTLVFPVIGPVDYTNDFGDPRPQGTHQGNDIMAPRKAIAVAAEAGKIQFHTTSASAGCMLYLYGDSGTTYLYIHLNNDLGASNDNTGSCVAGTAYAPGLKDGARVAAGQQVGFVGDSGDANGVHPHLHFEVHPNDGAAVSPFPYLKKAQHLLFTAPAKSTITLSLTGTLVSSTVDALTVRVQLLTVFPGGREAPFSGQSITLTLPAVVLGAPPDLFGKRVIVLTEPFQASLDTQLGKGLSVARIATLTAP